VCIACALSTGQLFLRRRLLKIISACGFQGQEKDDEVKGEGNSLNYKDRIYDSRVGRWLSLDPLQEKYPWSTPYHFVSNSPIAKIDIDGQWDIEVHAFKDRGKYGYAILIVKNKLGEEVYRTTVRVQGMKDPSNNNNPRNRNMKYGDTPTGKYKIGDSQGVWLAKKSKKDIKTYGPNPILRLDYLEGEGEGRNQMHVHGGRQEGEDYMKHGAELWNTGGCMRIKDEDLLKMKSITDELENNDPEEKPNLLNVTNDLEYIDGVYQIPIKPEQNLIDKVVSSKNDKQDQSVDKIIENGEKQLKASKELLNDLKKSVRELEKSVEELKESLETTKGQ